MTAMKTFPTIAAVALGSNSFRLQVGRVVDDQIYPLDSLREPVRLAAGLTADKTLDDAAQASAIESLKRFFERLPSLLPGALRALVTQPLLVSRTPLGSLSP